MQTQVDLFSEMTSLVGVAPQKLAPGAVKKKAPVKGKTKFPIYSSPCAECGLASYKKVLQSKGNPNTCKAIVILDRPSLYEASSNAPFTDRDTAAFLQQALGTIGLSMQEVYFMYALRCSCFDKEIDKDDIQRCGNFLLRDFASSPCKVVLCASTIGLKYMFQKQSLATTRGKVFEFQGKQVLCVQQPFIARKDPFQLSLFHNDMKRLRSLMDGNYKKPVNYYASLMKVSEIIELCDHLVKIANPDDPMGWDIESMWLKELQTYATDAYSPQFRCWHMALAWEDFTAAGFPFCPDPYLARKYGLPSVETHPELLASVKNVLENVRLIEHTKFDARAMMAKYGIEIGRGLERQDFDDTHAISFLINPEDQGGNDLKTLAWEHTTEGGYEKGIGFKKDINDYDWDDNIIYNCHDSDLARRIKRSMTPKLKETQQERVYEVLMRPFTMAALHMELDGVAMDVPYMREMQEKRRGEMQRALAPFYETDMVSRFVTHCKTQTVQLQSQLSGLSLAQEDKKKLEAKWRQYSPVTEASKFEPKNKHIAILLYEVLGLPVTRMTDDEEPSTDAEAIEDAAKKHKELKLLLAYKIAQKLESTYLTPYLDGKFSDEECTKLKDPPHIKFDGRIHPDIKLDKATGRTSMVKPNGQNIKNDKESRKPYKSRFPGGYLIANDYNQAEIRLAACQCRDPILTRALYYDIHWLNLSVLEKLVSLDELIHALSGTVEEGAALAKRCRDALIALHTIRVIESGVPANDPKFADAFKFYEKNRRTVAKKFMFGPMYGQTVDGMVAQIVIDTGMSKQDAEKDAAIFLPTLRSLYKRYFAWSDSNTPEARKNNYVQSIFGRRRPLNYAAVLSSLNTNDNRREIQLEQLDRKVTNTKVQGPASDICMLSAVHLIEIFKNRSFSADPSVKGKLVELALNSPLLDKYVRNGLMTAEEFDQFVDKCYDEKAQTRVVLPIHDSLISDAPADEAVPASLMIQSVMTNVAPFYIDTAGVPFDCECELGSNFGDVVPLQLS